MKVIRNLEKPANVRSTRPGTPDEIYFFCDKNTGVLHFRVEAGPDGRFPLEQAAGLLAMHCIARGRTPQDYLVVAQTPDHVVQGLTEKVEKLLHVGRPISNSVLLSRREEEVLDGIMHKLPNKRIAASLNLSERTVKHYVSRLFSKFHVHGRLALAGEVARRKSVAALGMFQPLAPETRRTRTDVHGPDTCPNTGPAPITPLKRQLTA